MNGLQSLMQGAPSPVSESPQARPMPNQNDPRMAAAMNVVMNDVPEPLQKLVDKKDFFEKAMELLQSAGAQAAMNQPPAKPPTVEQRVDQQAMEGVAALLQSLAPGLQQRGRQVQQAQARQMLGGGMASMGAPNMQRMADGGIVGYSPGGGVGSAYIDPGTGEPIPLNERIVKSLSPIREGLGFIAKPARMRELRARYPEASEAELETIYQESGLSGEYVYPSQSPVAEEVAVEAEAETTPAPAPAPATEELQRTGILDGLLSSRPKVDTDFRMKGVRSAAPTTSAPTAPPTTRTRMVSSVEDLVELANAPQDTTRPAIDSRLEGLRNPMITAVTERMVPDYEEEVRKRIQQEAQTAYAVPQEYRNLIEERRKELEKPLYTEEEAKSRRIDALLAGLASSNLIAESGPRAAANINAVTDAIKTDQLDRANKRFELSNNLMGKDMEASRAAFGEGIKVLQTAMNQVSVATQMAGSMLNQADNAAAAEALQSRQERLAAITNTISALGVIGQLERADIDAAIAVQRAATTELSSIQRALNSALSSLPMIPEKDRGSMQIQIDTLRTHEAAAISAIRAARNIVGIGTGGDTGQPLPNTSGIMEAASGAGGGTESTGDPELDKLLEQY